MSLTSPECREVTSNRAAGAQLALLEPNTGESQSVRLSKCCKLRPCTKGCVSHCRWEASWGTFQKRTQLHKRSPSAIFSEIFIVDHACLDMVSKCFEQRHHSKVILRS